MERRRFARGLRRYIVLGGAAVAVLLAYGSLRNRGVSQSLDQERVAVSFDGNANKEGDGQEIQGISKRTGTQGQREDFGEQETPETLPGEDMPGDSDVQNVQESSGVPESSGAQNVQESSGVSESPGMQEAADISEIQRMAAGTAVDVSGLSQEMLDSLFYSAEITEEVQQRIQGISFHENENISLEELRYLRVLHIGFDGQPHIGELIVNQLIAEDILEIMAELYRQSYPIEKMLLVDEYGADDERSMADNNTSAFNYREIAGSGRLSNHARGLAIDINPLYNPYVKQAGDGSQSVSPPSGESYADRNRDFPHKIDGNDLCCQLFLEHGFAWGGNWNSVKDYQHFEYGG